MDQGTLINNKTGPVFDLREIIDGEWVEAHFQPIVSLKRRSVVALEGLSRGIHPASKSPISPVELFRQAVRQNLGPALDGLCRKKVMDAFRPLVSHSPDLLLSLNLDLSFMNQGMPADAKHLRAQVAEMGLKPENIAIEIIESQVEDLKELQYFVEFHRDLGFLIALDDMGSGHSNLNRIPLIKPDILKIDRFLVQNIHEDFYKQEVLKSVAGMARRLGTLIIAEGVEKQEEVECLLDIDVDFIQGYYFSKPARPESLDMPAVLRKIDGMGGTFKKKSLEKVVKKRANMHAYFAILLEIQIELSQTQPENFDDKLKQLIEGSSGVECLYVLNQAGVQVTESICRFEGPSYRKKGIFHPAPKGTDHSMKEYFYFLTESGLGKNSYVTEPYLSMATGQSCVTLSAVFQHPSGDRYVICLDINHQLLKD